MAFSEVPPNLLTAKNWHVAFGVQWNRHEDIMRLEGRGFKMCLRQSLWKNDTLVKTVVILTDNMPLAPAITKGRASSSHLIQSCRVVCAAYSATLPYKLVGEPLGQNPADAPPRQEWPDTRATRLTTQPKVALARTSLCVAIATHCARAQRIRRMPLLYWRTKPCRKRRF